jgi:hypothetical protein
MHADPTMSNLDEGLPEEAERHDFDALPGSKPTEMAPTRTKSNGRTTRISPPSVRHPDGQA